MHFVSRWRASISIALTIGALTIAAMLQWGLTL